MRRPYVHIVCLAGILMVGFVSLLLVHKTDAPPVATSVVATLMTIDLTTSLATLQTEMGEQFALPQVAGWQVGDKVVCDRVGAGPRTRLHQCRSWP